MLRAFNKEWNRLISSIEASSTITTSCSRRSNSFLSNPPVWFALSNLWIVDAASSDDLDNLSAALPVGEQRAYFTSKYFNAFTIPFTTWVLPTPGPPVIIVTLFLSTLLIARFCSSDNDL